ncbi:hypothetical protein RJ639_026787 [Escallonia herrerae]|uniref:Glucan endo-1,3-beta-D-glucosidase n=1 Tax=Escallonia herrerae TaxID=1293975 RepID=A0AA89BKW2_9ASTE|nr:hypothetical protein RJ639_026787 [Escallonia herrerae]
MSPQFLPLPSVLISASRITSLVLMVPSTTSPLISCYWGCEIVITKFSHECSNRHHGSEDRGVCYGTDGNNLPSYADVVNLYKKYGISNVRLFDPNPDALEPLRGKVINVALGVMNLDIPLLADSWVADFVSRFHDMPFSYISVGNLAIPGEYAVNVAPAMQNI